MPSVCGIYYSVHEGKGGDSLPVVLIHGAGGTHLHWPPGIRRLSRYRVFALDLPGHGKSDAVDGEQSIAGYVHRVRDWMTAIGLSRAVLVGHSMGGAIVLEMAIRYPEQVFGIGLVSSGARLPVNPALLQRTAGAVGFYQALEMIVSWSFAPQAPPRLVELAFRRMSETRPSVLYGDLLACNSFDVTVLLERIDCPTLVVCGEEDKMTPMRYSQTLASAIPGARLERIANAGHMVMLEQPEQLTAVLSSFLERIPYSSGEVF